MSAAGDRVEAVRIDLDDAATIAVNSVCPGYVKTDLTGHNGLITPEDGARLPVADALLGEDAVSGRFVESADLRIAN